MFGRKMARFPGFNMVESGAKRPWISGVAAEALGSMNRIMRKKQSVGVGE